MMRTAQIPECRGVDGVALAIAMTITMARVRRTRRVVSKGPGKGREQMMGRGKGRRLRTGRGKGSGRGRETVKGKVLLNKPQGEMISHVPWHCSCRTKCMRQTRTRRATPSGYI